MTGAIDEYLTTFSNNLKNFRIIERNGEFDDQLIENIDKFLPFRDEAISLFSNIAQYAATEENIIKLHRFFETLIPYTYPPSDSYSWSKCDFDNFKFIIHELFLYAVAALIRNERFSILNEFLTMKFYIPEKTSSGKDPMTSYETIYTHISSLEHRNKRLNLNRLSLHADILKQRCKHSGFEFKQLMQADFTLFLRLDIVSMNRYYRWYPVTLVYTTNYPRTFEIYARASSKIYFEKIKCILSINQFSDLETVMNAYENNQLKVPTWQYEYLEPDALIGYKKLSTQP